MPSSPHGAPAFAFGNTQRTDTRVHTPPRHNWDLAFQKSENAGAGRITARVEVINAFDRPDSARRCKLSTRACYDRPRENEIPDLEQ